MIHDQETRHGIPRLEAPQEARRAIASPSQQMRKDPAQAPAGQIPAPLAIRRIRAFQIALELMDQALEDREGPV